jgi:hypothetical protein
MNRAYKRTGMRPSSGATEAVQVWPTHGAVAQRAASSAHIERVLHPDLRAHRAARVSNLVNLWQVESSECSTLASVARQRCEWLEARTRVRPHVTGLCIFTGRDL